jgi:hypothetical protein
LYASLIGAVDQPLQQGWRAEFAGKALNRRKRAAISQVSGELVVGPG